MSAETPKFLPWYSRLHKDSIYYIIRYMTTPNSEQRLSFLDPYTAYKSQPPVLSERHTWTVYNSSFKDYSEHAILPDYPDGLKGIVESQIGFNEDNVGIDIGGGINGVALQDLLELGVLSKALMTDFMDERSEKTKQVSELDHLAGHLLDADTWQAMIDWQEVNAPDGLALIMHRPVGGLQRLTPDVYEGATLCMFDMLQPGGLLFTQIPRRIRHSPEGPQILNTLRHRPDVGQVIISAKRKGTIVSDELDQYAVIIKSPVEEAIRLQKQSKFAKNLGGCAIQS